VDRGCPSKLVKAHHWLRRNFFARMQESNTIKGSEDLEFESNRSFSSLDVLGVWIRKFLDM
jgi:hypothetical protein